MCVFSDQEAGNTVAQVDFVPTISLLMGHPIPFSNLGRIIPSLFSTAVFIKDNKTKSSAQNRALKINAAQVLNFLRTYSEVSPDLPSHVIEKLEQFYESAMENQTLLVWSHFFGETFAACQSVWAKFDEQSIWFGVMFVGVSGLGLTLILLLTVGLLWIRDFYAVFSILVGIFHVFSMFSNSFQVGEDKTVSHLLQGLIWIHFLRTCQRVRPSWWSVIRFLSFTILIRSLELVRRCREEQDDCAVTALAVAVDGLDSHSVVHYLRLIAGLLTAIAMFLWVTKKIWIQVVRTGVWNSLFSWSAVALAVGLMVVPVMPVDSELRQIMLPRVVYGGAVVLILHLFISPVFITGSSVT